MNISEVLAAEVPEGIYLPAMYTLLGNIELIINSKHIGPVQQTALDSLCAAFSALMACAKGDRPLGDAEFCKQGYIQQGRSEAIKEVLVVVNETMRALAIKNGASFGHDERACGALDALCEVENRIRALEVPGDKA